MSPGWPSGRRSVLGRVPRAGRAGRPPLHRAVGHPGPLAGAVIIYAIRQAPNAEQRDPIPIRLRLRPVLRGQLGRHRRVRGRQRRGHPAHPVRGRPAHPTHGIDTATTLALLLYTAYNLAATVVSIPAGRFADQLGARGPVLVLTAGVAAFALAYSGFAITTLTLFVLVLLFLAAGIGIGAAETAEHAAVAALAPAEIRGSAFGLLATIQVIGNFAASAIVGLLWTLGSPTIAFLYLTIWMLLALLGLLTVTRTSNQR